MTHDQEARIRQRVNRGLGLPPADARALLEEIDRVEGWGENTMNGCRDSLTKARDALYGVFAALGLGYGASALLDELDEAVRQLGAGKG